MTSFKKTLFSAILVTFLIIPTGCGKKQNNNSASSFEVVTKTIGADGGQVADRGDNVQINIPAGALKESTSISAQYVEDSVTFSENPMMNFLCGVEFGPSGTTFDKPVEVTLKLNKTPINNELTVFCYDEINSVWDLVSEASVNNNEATFSITHFSKYKCIDIPLSVYNEYVYLVKDACRSGKPDSWITETYVDYLVNEKHLMDYYAECNGYVYEPTGILISGQFQVGDRESDNNVTVYLYGDSNQSGIFPANCYTLDGGLLSSYQEFKKQREKAAIENQEVIDIGLTVYFKMIKPIIDLSAPKTALAKRESTTVSVHCHYSKPDNYFPENREIDLEDYKLTLPYELVHLKTNKKELLTDSEGCASFKVTSIDGETETIKVMFYVEGVYGEYADAHITFTGEEDEVLYQMNGHIHEVYHWEYVVPDGGIFQTAIKNNEKGVTHIEIDYDFSGTISWDDIGFGSINGTVSYNNISATIQSNEAMIEYDIVASDGSVLGSGKASTELFSGGSVSTFPGPKNVPFNGLTSEADSANLCYFEDAASYQLIDIVSSGSIISNNSINGGGEDSFETGFSSYASDPILLNGFECKTGSQTFTVQSFKDSTGSRIPRYASGGTEIEFFYQLDPESVSVETTQTINITK